jgi:hypothetical protein
MVLFPLWLLKTLVIGGLVLCTAGVVTLLVFLIIDSKDKQIW